MRALTTSRSRAGLVAWAAARRSSKAGHTDATHSGWARMAAARCGEKMNGLAVGSPPVAAAKGGTGPEVASAPASEAGGEGKIGSAGGSPPVASALSAGADGGGASVDSQKFTTEPLATRAVRRGAAKVRHLSWHAAVMSSPSHEAGSRSPVGVQPGQEPHTVK